MKVKNKNLKLKSAGKKPKILLLSCAFAFLLFTFKAFAQEPQDLEVTLDMASSTVPLPRIFHSGIDLSGRGYHSDIAWPQTAASKEVIERWQKDIGFSNVYRLQYNLWEINQLSKDKNMQERLISNYGEIMKRITDAGGVLILNIFGTPAGLGQVLDKKSPPRDVRLFKDLIKRTIRELSCNRRYNIWYEVWNAPDLDDFFLGRKQEYLSLYRAVAESIVELEAETKIHIPIGGPSVSWWFQNIDGNTIATPERSLVYELIKFCYHYRLPLDFISWHGFSTDPKAEKENSIYKKTAIQLVRDWLSYFNLDRNIPLVVDEWNYDRDANVLAARAEKSFICASYIPARLKNMQEAGIDYQAYFCLEDFKENKEGVVRNVGIFSFKGGASKYEGTAKSTYNVFKMLSNLNSEMFPLKLEDPFIGVIASKSYDGLTMLVYNYIDPDASMNYVSRNIAALRPSERKTVLGIVKTDKMAKIMRGELEISKLRVTNSVKNVLKKARELQDNANKFLENSRSIKITIRNLGHLKNKSGNVSETAVPQDYREKYTYQKFIVDPSCASGCEASAREEKDIFADEPYQEGLTLKPYSVQMIVLKRKPREPAAKEPQSPSRQPEQPAAPAPLSQGQAVPSAAKSTEANAGAQQ